MPHTQFPTPSGEFLSWTFGDELGPTAQRLLLYGPPEISILAGLMANAIARAAEVERELEEMSSRLRRTEAAVVKLTTIRSNGEVDDS